MKPTYLVLNLYKGQTFNDKLVFTDYAGTPIDLSDRTALMHVRVNIEDPLPQLVFSTEDGGITLTAEGELTFFLAAEDTALLAPGQYDIVHWIYDLEWTLADGTVERPLEGTFLVWPEITR